MSGNHQSLTVNSQLTEAQCDVTRDGQTLAHINSTPGTVKIKRTSDDILIKCKKEGYAPSDITVDSDVNGWFFGNLLFGGILGLAVDISSGSNHAYDSDTNIVLPPLPAAPNTAYLDTLKSNTTTPQTQDKTTTSPQ